MNYTQEEARILHLLEQNSSEPDPFPDDSSEDEEVDNIVQREEDSESEQDIDPDENEDSLRKEYFHGGRDDFYYFSKDRTKWRIHPPPHNIRVRDKNIVTHLPGPRAVLRGKTDPLDVFRHFISDDMIDIIVKHTNQHILVKAKGRYLQEYQTKSTDVAEIESLLGILIISGVKKSNRMNAEEMFCTDGSAPEIFRLNMSLQRFRFLLNHIRFDDLVTRADRKSKDKLTPIRTFFDKFVQHCKSNYSVSQCCTVDEMLWGFRGKCSFRQFIPKKPAKYGLKVFALCDAKLYYTSNLEVYVGTQPPDSPFLFSNAAINIVERMIEPISGTKRHVTTDNWFTTLQLSEKLLSEHRLTHLGTIKKNKPNIPPFFVQAQNRHIPSSTFGFRENCTLVSYLPKKNKNVLLISSMHDGDEIDPETDKPQMIIDYNSTKGGVDIVDRLCANYDVSRNSRRWPMVIFYHIINIAGINSQIVIVQNDPTNTIVRRHFLTELGLSLMKKQLLTRSTCQNIPRLLRERAAELTKNDIPQPGPAQGPEVQFGRCRLCPSKKNRKSKYKCRSCNKFFCLEHILTDEKILCKECE